MWAVRDRDKFQIVAQFDGMLRHHNMSETSLGDVRRSLIKHRIRYDITSKKDSDYLYLATECGPPEKESFWWHWKREVRNITVGEIITARKVKSFFDDIGAWATDENTMGTLGGPLGHVLPDVSCRMESAECFESIRLVPEALLDTKSEEEWNDMKEGIVKYFDL